MTIRLGLCFALVALGFPALAATQVGVTSAVLPAARGTPPARETRVLQVGLDMQANERVQTDADGKAQLLFVDGSALSVGPNSDVTLDEFVYDPDKQSGKIALSATRGVFRLVGGKISKNTPVTLTTPAATIGVRGGIVIVEVGQQVSAKFLFGSEMTVAGAGGAVTRIGRPGTEVIATAAGPGEARPLTEASVAASMGAFENQNAPAPGSPAVSDDDVASTQVTALNSTAGLADAAPAAGGGGPAPTGEAAGGVLRDAAQSDGLQQAMAMTQGGGSPPGNSSGPTGPAGPSGPPAEAPGSEHGGPSTPPAGFSLPAATTFTGVIRSSGVGSVGGSDPLLDGQFNPFVAFASPFAATLAGSPGAFEVNADAGAFTAEAAGDPFGAEASFLGVGQNFGDEFFVYELFDEGTMERVLAVLGAPTPATAIPTGGATFYAVRRDFVLDSDMPFVPADFGSLLGGVGGLQLPGPAAAILWDGAGGMGQRSFGAGAIAIVGQGAAQASSASVSVGKILDDPLGGVFLFGGMRGSRQPVTSGGFFTLFSALSSADGAAGVDFYGAAGPDYFLAESNLVDGTDAFVAGGLSDIGETLTTTYYPNSVYTRTAGALGPRTTRQFQGFAAGYLRAVDSGGVFQSDGMFDTGGFGGVTMATDAVTNQAAAIFAVDERFGTTPSLQFVFGDDTGVIAGRSAFIDDQRFLAIENATQTASWDGDSADARLYLTTSHAVAVYGLLPAGVSFCACQYSAWGFWGGDAVLAGGSSRALSHLATWVAGPVSSAASIAGLTGTATYNGHLVGTVQNGLNVYTAVGGLQLNVNFGAQQISGGSITSFDGFDYQIVAGAPFGSPGGFNAFNASIQGAPGPAAGISGQLDGSFVGGGGDAAAEAIGQAYASQGGYRWVGVFAGKR